MPSNSLKFSPDPMPRPPEITILAAVSSGLSDLDSSSPKYSDLKASCGPSNFSIDALPASSAEENAVVRTVTTFLVSLD